MSGVITAYSYPKKRMGVKKLKQKNQKGFTLIELLVVIAIIGLLASVVLLALNSARAKARDARRISDLRQIATAAQLHFDNTNTYVEATGGGFGDILPEIPDQPLGGDCGTANADYGYTATATTFTADSCIEQGYDGAAGPGTLTVSETGSFSYVVTP